jgi:hypothetical protein
MKTQIDIKSALFGIVVGVLAMFAIGAGTSSNEVGRYQISSAGERSVMIDTITGKAWAVGVLKDPMYYPSGGKNNNFWDAK